MLVVLGSVLGFWAHNRPPAAIFMGDAGSYVLDFFLAIASLLATYASYHGSAGHAVLAPLCVLAVPLYDTITVVAIRLSQGNSPFQCRQESFFPSAGRPGSDQVAGRAHHLSHDGTCGLGGFLLHEVRSCWGGGRAAAGDLRDWP